MAVTLAESAKLSTDLVRQGVIETVIKESPVLANLPFESVVGNAYKYAQENAMASAAFYAVNAAWTEDTMTFTQQTVNLAILGGDADVDNFIQRTRSNITDQRATQVFAKAKAVAHKFEDTFLNGDTGSDPNSFNGLKTLVSGSQTVTAGTNGAQLSLSLLDQLIDLVRPGKPDCLLMSRRSRRALKALLQQSSHYVERGETAFGAQVLLYDGIPVFVSDFQSDAETQGTANNASSIYAISWGDGVMGFQNGNGPEVVEVGQLESKDAFRTRIRWYCAIGILAPTRVARLKGIIP